MSFRNTRGSISVFAFMVVSMIAVGLGSLMMSNFSVYQLSKSYHVCREQLLIKKMLFQMTEEVVLSKYELSNAGGGLSVGSLEEALAKEVNSVVSKMNLPFDDFKLIEDKLTESNRIFSNSNAVFENDCTSLNPRFSSYLIQGPYTHCGQASFSYTVDGRSYIIQTRGYGVPLSNVDLRRYYLPLSLRVETESGLGVKGDISYKNRKDISIICNAYEWLWKSDYLEKLAKNSANRFVLELPYNGEDGEDEALKAKGITVADVTRLNEITLDLGKIDFDVLVISDPLGEGKIKIAQSVGIVKPLIVISHSNSTFNQRTFLEIDQSCTRPVVLYALNTEIIFRNNPQVKGAFFLDPNSTASGEVVLDGHFSCYAGVASQILNPSNLNLNLKFNSTASTKAALAKLVPHVFLTDIFLKESL